MTTEQSRTSVQERGDLSQIIKIDEAKVSDHLSDLFRGIVQETLNEMLDAEAQEMCDARNRIHSSFIVGFITKLSVRRW